MRRRRPARSARSSSKRWRCPERGLELARSRIRQWARRRQGPDADPVTLHRRRIYILPTRLGAAFGALVFVILLGAMNYNNSLGLALAFLLGGLILVTMHHCHRNLDGLQVAFAGVDPVFAGQAARFGVRLCNASTAPRYGLLVTHDALRSEAADLAPGAGAELHRRCPPASGSGRWSGTA